MFSFGKQYFLGLDVGTSSIKAVVLSVKGSQPVLVNYGEAGLSTLSQERVSNQGNYDAIITVYLRALLDKMGVQAKGAYVAMPAFIGLTTLVEFPEMSERELGKAIEFEAHKYIPTPLEEVTLSWEIVGERRIAPAETPGKETKRMEVLLVAALNKEVERYESYIQAVRLEMQLLELETFSLVRAIVNGDTGVYLVIDIGSRATNLVFVENGLVKVSRNLDVGGQDITRTITDSLAIAPDRAEVLKKSGKDFLTVPEGRLVFPALESIVGEARRMMQNFSDHHPQARFDGIILSGGTARLAGLPQYLSTALGIPASLGNPWRQITYDAKLARSVERMGTSFSVALGLALQGVATVVRKK